MTAVFVHGVPETPAVWHGLLAALGRPDTVTLSLPILPPPSSGQIPCRQRAARRRAMASEGPGRAGRGRPGDRCVPCSGGVVTVYRQTVAIMPS